jgi:hypothetical protein
MHQILAVMLAIRAELKGAYGSSRLERGHHRPVDG